MRPMPAPRLAQRFSREDLWRWKLEATRLEYGPGRWWWFWIIMGLELEHALLIKEKSC